MNDKPTQILEEIDKIQLNKTTITLEEEKIDLVIFSLNDKLYAIEGLFIKEILPYQKICFVPGCPSHLLGIINVRGDIESVISLHCLLGLDEQIVKSQTRILIASGKLIRSGVLVDSVQDVMAFSKSEIQAPICTLDKNIRDFVEGVTKYKQDYVTVLNLEKIFERLTL